MAPEINAVKLSKLDKPFIGVVKNSVELTPIMFELGAMLTICKISAPFMGRMQMIKSGIAVCI